MDFKFKIKSIKAHQNVGINSKVIGNTPSK